MHATHALIEPKMSTNTWVAASTCFGVKVPILWSARHRGVFVTHSNILSRRETRDSRDGRRGTRETDGGKTRTRACVRFYSALQAS